jgi:hypothetical protein
MLGGSHPSCASLPHKKQSISAIVNEGGGDTDCSSEFFHDLMLSRKNAASTTASKNGGEARGCLARVEIGGAL